MLWNLYVAIPSDQMEDCEVGNSDPEVSHSSNMFSSHSMGISYQRESCRKMESERRAVTFYHEVSPYDISLQL